MIRIAKKTRKSQALLDFILVFGILIAFLVGLVHIWIWFNANYAKRNVDYQWTREAAGTANDATHASIGGIYNDATIPLDDNWVFKGDYSGGAIPLPPGASSSGELPEGIDAEAQACASARLSAANYRAQADDLDNQAATLNFGCDDDEDSCEDGEARTKRTLRQQALEFRTQADTIENSACN